MYDRGDQQGEEWLELGPPPAASTGPRRVLLVGFVGLIIIVLAAIVVVRFGPYLTARQTRLDRAQVEAALAGLDLSTKDSEWRRLKPGAVRSRCDVLGMPMAEDESGNILGLSATGSAPGGGTEVRVTVLLFDTPEGAGRQFEELAAALQDEACLAPPTGNGRFHVDAETPDRQLGYSATLPNGSRNGDSDALRVRLRMLRYGNTLNYALTFGSAGSTDVAAGVADALDQAYLTN